MLFSRIIHVLTEALEGCALFSGNVVVSDANGLISITGDPAANSIYVTQVKGGHLKIAGAAGTVNGLTAYTTARVTQYVTIAMCTSDDYVNLSKLTMPYSVKVDDGAGKDTTSLKSLQARAGFSVSGSGTSDDTGFTSVDASGLSWLSTGNGNDTLFHRGFDVQRLQRQSPWRQ